MYDTHMSWFKSIPVCQTLYDLKYHRINTSYTLIHIIYLVKTLKIII